MAGSEVETDAEGGQVMRAVVAAGAGRGLVWASLGRWRVSAGTGSGAVGATAAGKKFSRLSLGCFGVVGVSPVACEDKREMRKTGWAALSLYCPTGWLSRLGATDSPHSRRHALGPQCCQRGAQTTLKTLLMLGHCWGPEFSSGRTSRLCCWPRSRSLRLARTSSRFHPPILGASLGGVRRSRLRAAGHSA